MATLGSRFEFPAFFTPSSGFQAPYRLDTTSDAARLVQHCLAFNTGSGLLIAVPIPESSQADGEAIERAIRSALTLADQQKIRGRDVTPFVLSQVNLLTSGASLTASKRILYFIFIFFLLSLFLSYMCRLSRIDNSIFFFLPSKRLIVSTLHISAISFLAFFFSFFK